MDGSDLKPESGNEELRDEHDRLSSFPDHLIHHILSFIPTKYVVATSVLSTRWYSLWTSTSNLEICDQLLYSPGTTSSDVMVKTSFMNFVDRVLSLHSASTLTKFSLSCHEVYDDTRVNAWFSTAFSCNVQELILVACLEKPFVFPHSIFNCESLTTLKIDFEDVFHLNIPSSICFPNLKHLDLARVWFCGDQSTQQVFFSFPVLKEFTACELRLLKISIVEISAPILETLIVDEGVDGYEDQPSKGNEMGDHEVIIDAENLVFLNLSSILRRQYFIHCKSSEIRAIIYVSNVNRLKLLGGICNVKYLQLIVGLLGLFGDHIILDALPHLPTLSSLVDLTVSLNFDHSDVAPLIKLLHKMPNIETLNFDAPYTCGCHENGLGLGIVPQCVLSRLKFVHLGYFDASEFELCLVKFFLENARSLERITLVSSDEISKDPKKKVEATKLLQTMPRASSCCMIDFD